MNKPRVLNLAVAAVFLVVGILATANTFRLNSYIHETLPRDKAQEQCARDTIDVLRMWAEERIQRDKLLDQRDDAAIVLLDHAIHQHPALPSELTRWRDAINASQQERESARELFREHPLPTC